MEGFYILRAEEWRKPDQTSDPAKLDIPFISVLKQRCIVSALDKVGGILVEGKTTLHMNPFLPS